MSPVWVSRGFSQDVSRAEETDSSLTRQTAEPLSGPFPSTSPFFFSTEPEPQKRSGALFPRLGLQAITPEQSAPVRIWLGNDLDAARRF